MRSSVRLVGVALVAAAISTASFEGASAKLAKSPTAREQAEHLCYNDATTLCNDAVPDEDKITACMKVKRAQLSPGCRKVFDQGLKDEAK